jgi:hypothetical protein
MFTVIWWCCPVYHMVIYHTFKLINVEVLYMVMALNVSTTLAICHIGGYVGGDMRNGSCIYNTNHNAIFATNMHVGTRIWYIEQSSKRENGMHSWDIIFRYSNLVQYFYFPSNGSRCSQKDCHDSQSSSKFTPDAPILGTG